LITEGAGNVRAAIRTEGHVVVPAPRYAKGRPSAT
jgi:hypothetical protein